MVTHKRSVGDREDIIDGISRRLTNSAEKDWAHRSIEGSHNPVTEVFDWVRLRVIAIVHELDRTGVVIHRWQKAEATKRRMGRDIDVMSALVFAKKGNLPLVGNIEYVGRSWNYFDGKLTLEMAVPTKEFGMSVNDISDSTVYQTGRGGETTYLRYIDRRTSALSISFAKERMKTSNKIAVALVESIGRI